MIIVGSLFIRTRSVSRRVSEWKTGDGWVRKHNILGAREKPCIGVLYSLYLVEIWGSVLVEQSLTTIINQLFNSSEEAFLDAELDVLQNRTCRCLANLLLSPRCWKLAENTEVMEKIVKLLKDTENMEFKLTYIRAVR